MSVQRNSGGSYRFTRKNRKPYVDPLIGMSAKSFIKKVREVGRDKETEDETKARERRRLAFVGGMVNVKRDRI